MLNEILKSVNSEVGGNLISKVGLTKDQAAKAMQITGSATMDVVTKQLKGGDLSTLMNLFSNKPNTSSANGVQDQISKLIAEKLSSTLGLSKSQVQQVITTVLPIVMNQISRKNDETPDDDPSPLMEIFGDAGKNILKGGAGGLLGKLF